MDGAEPGLRFAFLPTSWVMSVLPVQGASIPGPSHHCSFAVTEWEGCWLLLWGLAHPFPHIFSGSCLITFYFFFPFSFPFFPPSLFFSHSGFSRKVTFAEVSGFPQGSCLTLSRWNLGWFQFVFFLSCACLFSVAVMRPIDGVISFFLFFFSKIYCFYFTGRFYREKEG